MAERQKWEYCVLEWIWNQETMRVNLPNGRELVQSGSYAELVRLLTQLGADGWEVVSNAGFTNWLLWVLKRPVQQ